MKPLSLAKAVEFYLHKRRQLGFPLKEDGQMLRQLVAYAAARRLRGPLTKQLALAWAQAPAAANRLWWARRLDAARRFATFWRAFDPRTEVPPPGVLGPSYRRRAVHLYRGGEIAALMQAACDLGGLRGLTFQTLIGLLACSGLRIGEALRLHEQDIDWTAGLLTVRHSKLGRSRCLPLHVSTRSALSNYRQKRRKHLQPVNPTPLFVGQNGRVIHYFQAAATFRWLRQRLGWDQRPVPRLHDLRHTFAVGCLKDWYRQGDEVGQKVLALATYLGHSSIGDTFRLLLRFIEQKTGQAPSQQRLPDWNVSHLAQFLDFLEKERRCQVRTRNTRLAAIRSFMRYVAQEEPSALGLTQRVLAIPMKRFDRPLLGHLSRPELEAILATTDLNTPSGRRDHLLVSLLYNTGARVSEILALQRQQVREQPSHLIEITGKGRNYAKVVVMQRYFAETLA